jgi:hypothetical protein
MSRRIKLWSIASATLFVLVALGYGGWRYEFPFGYSHCCDTGLYFALSAYAGDHNGAFPSGNATPEASLSLLYPTYASAYLLAGKAVSESEAETVLNSGSLLGPQTCSWHYVEGLTVYDHPRLALFWDKTGLGHNGQRQSGGGHTVLFIDGDRRHIFADEWDKFLEDQQALLTQRRNGTEIRLEALLPDNRTLVQLMVVNGNLRGRVFSGGQLSSEQGIAHVDKQPEEGLVGLPVVTAAELRAAKVLTEKQRIRFILKDRQIVFDGSEFHIE